MTSATTASCARCDRPLAHPEAVCAHCEQDLARAGVYMDGSPAPASSQQASSGPFVCPWCSWHFEQPLLLVLPPGTRWWQPSGYCPQCPHCQGFLRDTNPLSYDLPWIVLLTALLVTLAGRWMLRQWDLGDFFPVWAMIVMVLVSMVHRRRWEQREGANTSPTRYARWDEQMQEKG